MEQKQIKTIVKEKELNEQEKMGQEQQQGRKIPSKSRADHNTSHSAEESSSIMSVFMIIQKGINCKISAYSLRLGMTIHTS